MCLGRRSGNSNARPSYQYKQKLNSYLSSSGSRNPHLRLDSTEQALADPNAIGVARSVDVDLWSKEGSHGMIRLNDPCSQCKQDDAYVGIGQQKTLHLIEQRDVSDGAMV